MVVVVVVMVVANCTKHVSCERTWSLEVKFRDETHSGAGEIDAVCEIQDIV